MACFGSVDLSLFSVLVPCETFSLLFIRPTPFSLCEICCLLLCLPLCLSLTPVEHFCPVARRHTRGLLLRASLSGPFFSGFTVYILFGNYLAMLLKVDKRSFAMAAIVHRLPQHELCQRLSEDRASTQSPCQFSNLKPPGSAPTAYARMYLSLHLMRQPDMIPLSPHFPSHIGGSSSFPVWLQRVQGSTFFCCLFVCLNVDVPASGSLYSMFLPFRSKEPAHNECSEVGSSYLLWSMRPVWL